MATPARPGTVRGLKALEAAGVPLTRLPKREKATVLAIVGDSAHERNKLMALGVMPGVELKLIQRFPSYVIQIGYSQLALDKETAASILVQQESAEIDANKRG